MLPGENTLTGCRSLSGSEARRLADEFGIDAETCQEHGPGVRAGLLEEAPTLLGLEEGDVKMTTDFRQVYATVLEKRLKLTIAVVFSGQFAKLSLLRE
jgi:hypothetical protein